MNIRIKHTQSLTDTCTVIDLHEVPIFVESVKNLQESYNSIKKIKDIVNNEELLKSDILDAFYFITRDKLIKFQNNAIESVIVQIDSLSDFEFSFLKKSLPEIKKENDETIVITLDDLFIEESQGYINYVLYKIISNKDKIKDINTVYHFIDNHYESRFSDLILKFNLNKEYTNKILQNINPVVLHEYQLLKMELPSVEEILQMDEDMIKEYYFKIWKNSSIENKGHTNLQLIKSPKADAEMIIDFCSKTEFSFIYKDILTHRNCPKEILESAVKVDEYVLAILTRDNLSEDLVDMIYHNQTIYPDLQKVYDIMYNHTQVSEKMKDQILSDLQILSEKIYFDISKIDTLSPNMQNELYNLYPDINPNKQEEILLNSKNNFSSFDSGLADFVMSKVENLSLIEVMSFMENNSSILTQVFNKKLEDSRVTEIIEFIEEEIPNEVLIDSALNTLVIKTETCSPDESILIFDFLSKKKIQEHKKNQLLNSLKMNENTNSFILEKIIS